MPHAPVELTETAGEMVLSEGTLGYHPGRLYCQHLIQTTLSAGTWALAVRGPRGAWTTLKSGIASGAVIAIGPRSAVASDGTLLPTGRYAELKVIVTGGDGAGKAAVQSEAVSLGQG